MKKNFLSTASLPKMPVALPKAPRLARLTPHTPRHRDPAPAREIAVSEIAGNLTYTASTVTAWYALPEQVWAFRPNLDREAIILAIAEQYAAIGRFRIHLRRTTRPFPVDAWVTNLTGLATPLPDVPGAPSWDAHVAAARAHLGGGLHTEGQTLLGVEFARRHLGDTAGQWIRNLFGKGGVSAGELADADEKAGQFDDLLAAPGLGARPATVTEVTWMLTRSIGLFLAPPDRPATDLGPEDILGLSEHVETYRTRYGSTVLFRNRHTGEEQHAAVLTFGRMEPQSVPERHDPWLHVADRAPFPVEISARFSVLTPEGSAASLEQRLLMIRSQQNDYETHKIPEPAELGRLVDRAVAVSDDIATGLPVDSVRAHGWIRVAVAADTEKECLKRVHELTRIYQAQSRISLQHTKGQAALAREFIPGEPLANAGHLRRMPVKMLAAALPQATAKVGDRRGDLIGTTTGAARRPVFLDLHFPMEVRERSGLQVFVAEPGAGKSTLLGALSYLNVRRGVQTTVFDPSGPLARLALMPELAPYARVLNLAKAPAGTLNPYALVATPRREDFGAWSVVDRNADPNNQVDDSALAGQHETYSEAVAHSCLERRALVADICTMLLPPQLVSDGAVITNLRNAVRRLPAEESTTLDDLIDELDDYAAYGRPGQQIAEMLRYTAEMPLGKLFFGQSPAGVLTDDVPMLIITMAGLRLPNLKVSRDHWTTEEALALPMLHTAQRLAVRRCYSGDMHRRKLVALDEAHFMQGWESGRAFLDRLARDSRKWNIAALVASQNPADILSLDVQNLVSTVFVGRIAKNPQILAGALELLDVPAGAGHEQTIAGLSQVDTTTHDRLGFREFVIRDVDGRIQEVRVDLSYVPHLLTYLNTTPGGAR